LLETGITLSIRHQRRTSAAKNQYKPPSAKAKSLYTGWVPKRWNSAAKSWVLDLCLFFLLRKQSSLQWRPATAESGSRLLSAIYFCVSRRIARPGLEPNPCERCC
jgi:hypothetical protein